MATKVLSIVSTPYRGTVEEQDDTVLWLTAMCASAGLDVSVLLSGSAVSYGLRGQDASGLSFGDRALSNPPTIDRDIEDLVARGVSVSYVVDDLAERAIDTTRLVDGIKPVTRAGLPAVMAGFDQVWHW
jgi:hypothetical protein